MESGATPSATRARKRKRDPSNWKRNVRKRMRQLGKEYTDRQGRKREEKKVKPIRCKCVYDCLKKVTEEERHTLFRKYWGYNLEEKRHFINKYVEKRRKRSGVRKTDSRRNHTYHYHVPLNGSKIEVCKKFYLATFDVGQKTVYNVLENAERGEGFLPQHQRGKRGKPTVPEETKQNIRNHINLFPRVASHYCRANSQRKYLDPSLSISKMFTLYEEWCNKNNFIKAKQWQYYKIFNTEFNLGFHHPKKDLCDLCEKFNATGEKDDSFLEQHRVHLERKEEARRHKQKDKADAKADSTHVVTTFDLEKVLIVPSLTISKVYYLRKLNTYNFTLYNLVNRDVDCLCGMKHKEARGVVKLQHALSYTCRVCQHE